MARIVAIVEGHGEVAAVPILLRRIAAAVVPTADIDVLPPIRVDRYGVVKQNELERAVELAARMVGTDGSILILLDADDDCPADLGRDLLQRAGAARPDFAQSASCWPGQSTKRGSWRQQPQSPDGMTSTKPSMPPDDPEGIRNAKGWLTGADASRSFIPSDPTSGGTDEVLRPRCRPSRAAPSFDKLWRDVRSLRPTRLEVTRCRLPR